MSGGRPIWSVVGSRARRDCPRAGEAGWNLSVAVFWFKACVVKAEAIEVGVSIRAVRARFENSEVVYQNRIRSGRF